MNNGIGATTAALVAAGLLATGCGSSTTKTTGTNSAATKSVETDPGAKAEPDSAKTACRAKATSKPTGLPAAFPIPGELVLTQAQKDGPTTVVDGYWTAGIDAAYREYKDQVGQAGYTVLHTEKEEHDAEINYKGSGRTGQIALRGDCTEAATTRVHITNRPA